MLTDILISLTLIVGAFFVLVGSFGLLKLDNPMSRLHAPTKASTLGVGALLLASMIHYFAEHEGSLREMLIMAFIFVTAPITANFVAKVHIHRERTQQELPEAPGDQVWATDLPPEARDDMP